MSILLDGTLGITSPAETVQGALTTTGNTILGDATTDTLTVGVTGIVKDASGNVGIGTASPTQKLQVYTSAGSGGQIQITNSATGATATDGVLIGYDSSNDVIINNQEATQLKLYTSGVLAASINAAGALSFNSGYGSAATAYGCRAWVNFNGTGTVAIRASGNVSSITDNGTGDYTVNFTTAMPDANYQINTSIGVLSTGSGGVAGVYTSATVPTASLCRVFSVGNSTDTITDTAYFYVSIFR